MRVALTLVTLYAKSVLQYRGAFFANRIAQIISDGASYIVLWVLLNHFRSLGGWSWPELALLVAFQKLAYSIGAAVSLVQLSHLDELVRRGTFDTLMIKPISPWLYLVLSGLNIGYTGHIALALMLLAWSLTQVAEAVSLLSVAYLALTLISASMLVASVITAIATLALVLGRSNYLYSLFFGLWDLTLYPLNIYPPALHLALLIVLPLGFGAYIPVATFLGKDVLLLGGWASVAALTAGPIAATLAALHWRWAVRRYQGAGG